MNAILFLSLLLTSHLVFASYVGSVTAATGDTGLAAVEASETPFMNPASLGHTKGYYFTAGFGSAKQTNVGNNQDLALSVTDAMPDTVVATSLAYVQNSRRFEGENDNSVSRSFRLSFGNMIGKKVAIGLGINHDNDRWGLDNYQQTNLETGLLWTPNSNIGAALVFKNMIPANDSIPEAVRQTQRIGLGSSYNHKKFVRFKFDINSGASNSFKYSTLGAGMESYLNRWLVIRWGGERNNEVSADLYSAGLGFLGPKFALNYAYQTSPQNERLTRHSVDLAVPIW